MRAILNIIIHREKHIDEKDCFKFSSHGTSLTKVAIFQPTTTTSKRQKKVEFENIGFTVDVPKSIVSSNAVLLICHYPLDYGLCNENDKDSFLTIGGTYEFNLIKPPAKSNCIEEWKIVRVHDQMDKISSYEPIALGGSRNGSQTTSITSQMIKCHVNTPKSIVIPDDCKVARFDENLRVWSQDNLPVAKIDKNEKKLTFYMSTPGRYSLISDRCLDFPYTDWSIYPLSPKEIIFNIFSSRFHFSFSITDTGCLLLSPNLPEFQDIMDGKKRYKPCELLRQLQLRGINLLPSKQDSERLGIQRKIEELEARIYQDISICVISFCFKSIKSTCCSNKAIYKVSETGIFAGKAATDLVEPMFVLAELDNASESFMNAPSSVKLPDMCGNIKVALIRDIDESTGSITNTFIHERMLRDSKTSLYLFKALSQQVCSKESCDKILEPESAGLRFKALQEMLLFTRPLSYQQCT